MKTLQANNRGTAGIIMSLLVMSLLMLFANSYVELTNTETQFQNLAKTANLAMDAAYSGVHYVTSFAQTSPAMFADTSIRAKDRLYFTLFPADAAKITSLFSTITDKPAVSAPNLIQADWIFVDQEIDMLDEDNIYEIEKDGTVDDNEDEYQFRAVSYPKKDDTNNTKIDPEFYMIKSQGKYTDFSSGAEYKFQIIAEIKITVTPTSRRFKINRWRQMEFQSDNDLNSYTAF